MRDIGAYDYAGLCACFTAQDRPSGKTAEDRMSFSGNKIYSYSSLLAVLDTKTNTLLMDKHIATYSVTSVRHASMLTKYFHGDTVYHVDLDNRKHLDWSDVEMFIKKHHRARSNKQAYADAAVAHYKTTLAYADYIGFDKRSKEYKQHIKLFVKLMERKML